MDKSKYIWKIQQSTKKQNTLDIYIYSDIKADSFDWLKMCTVESTTSGEYFKKELAKYPGIEHISLYVNSLGGSIYEAVSIRNQLKRNSAYVTGYVDGFACSAASFILTGCDKVIMYSNTMQMIHNIWNMVIGNSKQLRKAADDLDTIMIGNRQAYLEKSGGKITEKKLIEFMDAETWLTADQCIQYGLADEVIRKEVDLTSAKQMVNKANQLMSKQIQLNKELTAQLKGIDIVKPAKSKENKLARLFASVDIEKPFRNL